MARGGSGGGGGSLRRKPLFVGLRVLAPLRPSEQQLLFIWAAIVGFLGAAAALLFQVVTSVVQRLFTGRGGDIVESFAALPAWQRLVVPILGGALAGGLLMLSQRFIRRRETDYMEGISLGNGDIPLRPSLARASSALISIASGEAIGREGPLVQLAAITGSLSGRVQRMSAPRRRVLVACGAAAGIAAAYHTPLGGALFIAEIVLGSLAMEALGPLLIASVVSALTVRGIQGVGPLYPYADFGTPGIWEFVLFAVLGAACGAGAAGWNLLLRKVKLWFGAVPGPTWLRLALGGAVVGALAMWQPEVTGNGTTVIRGFLAADYTWRMVFLLLVLRVVATVATFGSGAVGGVFTPSLLIGGATGFLFAAAAGSLWPAAGIDPGGLTLIGMGSFMAAAAQAPITAMIMLFEFTLQYDVVLPLMVGVVAAYFTARALGSEGLYAESLRSGPRSLFDRPLETLTAGDLLRPQPAPLRVNAPFREIARQFLRSSDREQWIAHTDGRLAGAVFLSDVEPHLRDPHVAEAILAIDILRTRVPRLRSDQTLAAALDCFTHCPLHTIPVVDGDDRLLGALVREDLLLTISELATREGSREPADPDSCADRLAGPDTDPVPCSDLGTGDNPGGHGR